MGGGGGGAGGGAGARRAVAARQRVEPVGRAAGTGGGEPSMTRTTAAAGVE